MVRFLVRMWCIHDHRSNTARRMHRNSYAAYWALSLLHTVRMAHHQSYTTENHRKRHSSHTMCVRYLADSQRCTACIDRLKSTFQQDKSHTSNGPRRGHFLQGRTSNQYCRPTRHSAPRTPGTRLRTASTSCPCSRRKQFDLRSVACPVHMPYRSDGPRSRHSAPRSLGTGP